MPEAGQGKRAHGGKCDQGRGNAETDIRTDHEDISMGKVEQHQDGIDHGIAKGDESIEAPPLQAVYYVLEKEIHEEKGSRLLVQGSGYR